MANRSRAPLGQTSRERELPRVGRRQGTLSQALPDFGPQELKFLVLCDGVFYFRGQLGLLNVLEERHRQQKRATAAGFPGRTKKRWPIQPWMGAQQPRDVGHERQMSPTVFTTVRGENLQKDLR